MSKQGLIWEMVRNSMLYTIIYLVELISRKKKVKKKFLLGEKEMGGECGLKDGREFMVEEKGGLVY